ncbi:hypothetical protein [Methylomonas sp. AM2-LC]|uniref:hypothetical protein n=1 Tax=Methylomonas sp. AM2-LC TaxID=3153301 RepID=UPI00326614EA
MTDPNNKVIPVQTGTLVSQGKSSRLQAMHEQAMKTRASQTVELTPAYQQHQKALHANPDLLLAQQVIDTRLAEIVAMLPAGKQNRLFKLRFGVELAEIRNLPVQRIVNLLAINHPQLHKLLSSKNSIAELNYNGE